MDSSGKPYTMGYSRATTASHESRTIQSDAAFLIPYIKPNFKILDLGCGPGTITTGFAALVSEGSVIGLDYGNEILKLAAALAASRGMPKNLTFQQGNVLEGLPFEDASFDVIFCSQVLGHLRPQPEAPITAMREVRRLLKPGGVFGAREAAAQYFWPYGQELNTLWHQNLIRSVGAEFPGPKLKSWLRQAGFEVDNNEKTKIALNTKSCNTEEQCRKLCDTFAGRLAPGDKFRASWIKAGVPEVECDQCIELMNKWAANEDAWYGIMQSDILAWK